MSFKITTQSDEIVLIEFDGNLLGGPDAVKLNEELHKLIDEGKNKVVAGLENVSFMNSSGLGMLIGGMTTLRKAGGDLRLAGANEKINKLLTITKLISVFQHFDTAEEAAGSFSGS